MNAAGRAWLASVEAWKLADRSDPDGMRAVTDRLRVAEAAFAESAEGRTYFAAPLAVLDESSGAVEVPVSQEVPPVDTVTIDAAAWAELQRQAAEAPALIEQARRVLESPTSRAGSVPVVQRPLAVLSAPQPAAEPSEADWSDFSYHIGLGGRPKPRPLMVVDPQYPGGVAPATSSLSGPSEEAFDQFTSSLGLGPNPYGKYSQ